VAASFLDYDSHDVAGLLKLFLKVNLRFFSMCVSCVCRVCRVWCVPCVPCVVCAVCVSMCVCRVYLCM
jgi:hypothetical protein